MREAVMRSCGSMGTATQYIYSFYPVMLSQHFSLNVTNLILLSLDIIE